MAASFLQWLQQTGFFSYIRESAYAYPALLWLHIAALIILGGMVVVTDLRLLNLGMRSYKVSDVVNGLRVPKRFGFIFAAVSGVLLFGAKAEQYSHSYSLWFWIKGALLVLMAGNYLLFRRAINDGAPTSQAKLAAVLSLLLGMSVISAGRGPATVKDVMHSMVDPSGDFLFRSVQSISDDQGVREVAPHTDAAWEDVRQHFMVLAEAPDLLQGRRAARPRYRSKNPAVESEPEDVQKLLDAEPSIFLQPCTEAA